LKPRKGLRALLAFVLTVAVLPISGLGFSADIVRDLGHVDSQNGLEQSLTELSRQISEGLAENQKQTIAVVEFVDLEGRTTNFGRFVAEELITRLYQTKKFKVIERQLLNKIVAEQKLSLGGMIDQPSAQKLGKLLGVDAIASGTVTDLGKSVRVNARLISTGTGEVFAVAAADIAKDEAVIALMGTGNIMPNSNSGGGSSASSQVPNAIASKDIGSLRVVLKSVLPLKLSYGRMGIRCSFEFINLETQRPIVVAMNLIPGRQGTSNELGRFLRSTLVDENGGEWYVPNSEVAGMSFVGVGNQGYAAPYYNPADIVTVLSQRDELKSDVTMDQRRGYEYRYMFGSTTEMSPGQSVAVTMSFVQDENQTTSGPLPKVFQIATEIVVGIAKTGSKRSYTLHNFTFDQVSMRGGS
jgi:TolB-like protein